MTRSQWMKKEKQDNAMIKAVAPSLKAEDVLKQMDRTHRAQLATEVVRTQLAKESANEHYESKYGVMGAICQLTDNVCKTYHF